MPTTSTKVKKKAPASRRGKSIRAPEDRGELDKREILSALRGLRRGDLSVRMPDDLEGVDGQIADVFNTMVDQQLSLEQEFSRVRVAVGREGRGRTRMRRNGVTGCWSRNITAVNELIDDVTRHTDAVGSIVNAVARGDLTRTMDNYTSVDHLQGDFLRQARSVDAMVERLTLFTSEVVRVAQEVGVDGNLGAQARVPQAAGVWKDLTDSVNVMASNLTSQVREIARVTTAVAQGDLTKTVNIEVRGELLSLKKTINTMVDQLSSFADEVTRVSREVGTEGKLGGQARVRGVSGVWRELTENVNSMADNLTLQVRNIADVATAIAAGDLSRKITVEAKGEILELKSTINTMVDQLGSFADEVSRVSREVGTEGVLGGQAEVTGVSGVWRELTENVNSMAENLTLQVRNIAEVTTAIANGDLSRKIQVDARGEILQLKNTVNTMVDQLSSFAHEVTRLATDVGVQGKLGGQADVRGVRGTWRDLTGAVNSMAENLTEQVRSISSVASAIAEGDLRKKIDVDARGEMLQLKNTINTMVDQLQSFAAQVSRVAREVGTEGKLGGQASVDGVRGTWKELTDNVNNMAMNLTNQVRDIADVATAIAKGDLDRKVTVEVHGELLVLKNTINTMVDQLDNFAAQVSRVAREVGVEGKLGGQAEVRGASGIWLELTGNVNLLASNLTDQVRDIAQVTTAVANGDLSRVITVEVRGEILQLKNTINTMVFQLRSFAGEVTRVAREVGTEGILGGQAEVQGVSGTWRELTDNVNLMARNLTEQVRGIARVVTAVADGDLKQQLTLSARGEIATLVDTINDMTITLSTFADQVSGVARDVGLEGRLGGQADVPGASGAWRVLTENVNELAGNLTRQVRAIGDVATAVTAGDLTQTIDVEARGEVATLKDNLNQMIRALAATTRLNREQDWLKTNLARLSRMLQGKRDLLQMAEQVLGELAVIVNARAGAFYLLRGDDDEPTLEMFASYALDQRKRLMNSVRIGEGLVGQAARERKRIVIENLPPDYLTVHSAVGEAQPAYVAVMPILFENMVKGVIELASFESFSEVELSLIDQLLEGLGIVVTSIEAGMRTDELLRQSQQMASELKAQQAALKDSNAELAEKASQLTAQKDKIERKNIEVELAKQALEEKAEQLSLTSKYKSQFLANMSHELRTPLNSLLILSRQLADNSKGNLDDKQVEYARTIHQAGADLLSLINEILDLAKVESGTMRIEVEEVQVADLATYLDRSFRHLAEEKDLAFTVNRAPGMPASLLTDDMRLRQILRNLVANALKFTEQGSVDVLIEPVPGRPGEVSRVAFHVHDTGIGIPADKQQVIFEAFQQADGSTSRKYGGTGLGLSISREIAQLLQGSLTVTSTQGEGSTFTLTLPARFDGEGHAAAHAFRAGVAERPEVLPGRARAPQLAATHSHAPRTPALPPRSSASEPKPPAQKAPPRAPALQDDRERIEHGDRTLLIVEDDETFAEFMLGAARKRGFRTLLAMTGEECLELARAFRPDAISLDLMIPDMPGLVLLDRLKHEPTTRHIPVHIISAAAEEHRSRDFGALVVIQKPVDQDTVDTTLAEMQAFLDRRVKRVLVVEDDEHQQSAIHELLTGDGVEVVSMPDGETALQSLQDSDYDCMILDLTLPGMSGHDLLTRMQDLPGRQRMPVIIYTSRDMLPDEQHQVAQLVQSIIIKDIDSAERLLDEASLLLHRPHDRLSEAQRESLASLEADPALAGKRALVVDDDVRNIYALTAILEAHGIETLFAENGRAALDVLSEDSAIDVVLMDIMMPEMDGYEATRQIRKDPRFAKLPVIAVTAKAMTEDRSRCLAAGASGYLTKPIDPDLLLSTLRVELYRTP